MPQQGHVRRLALKVELENFWLASVLDVVECRGPAEGRKAILHRHTLPLVPLFRLSSSK